MKRSTFESILNKSAHFATSEIVQSLTQPSA